MDPFVNSNLALIIGVAAVCGGVYLVVSWAKNPSSSPGAILAAVIGVVFFTLGIKICWLWTFLNLTQEQRTAMLLILSFIAVASIIGGEAKDRLKNLLKRR